MKPILLILLLFAVTGLSTKPKGIMPQSDEPATIDSLTVLRHRNAALTQFYRKNNFLMAWGNAADRKVVLDAIATCYRDGLNPNEYNLPKLLAAEKTASGTEISASYDILLTISLQKYLRHLSTGKLKPYRLYRIWDLPKKQIDFIQPVVDGISGDSIQKVIEKFRPQHPMYQKLADALQIINNYPKDRCPRIVYHDRVLSKGMKDSAMISIKKRLMYWGDLKQRKKANLLYDSETVGAVKEFQKRHGLAPDGVIGEQTFKALDVSREQRRRQIIANMERWRWFPATFGDYYIIVNVPDYKLAVVRNGDTIMEKKVVVGKSDRKTPVLTSAIDEITFNPTWTVPKTVIRNDLTPDAIRNRSHFSTMRIAIYDKAGTPVSAEDWNPAFPMNYRYIQSPGAHNSLGRVRFSFASRFSVYLHDTNAKSLFQKNQRALSSGCTRVEDAIPLAIYLLDDENFNAEKTKEILDSNQTRIVKLQQPVAIHQLYWTAWSENGQLIFRDDIYGLDQLLYSKLRK